MLKPCVVTPELLPDFQSLLSSELAGRGDSLLLLGLEEDSVPCGLLAGAPHGDAFELLSICVSPSHRRRGGGLRLLEVLLAVLEDDPEIRCVRCVWKETAERSGAAPLFRAAGFAVEPADGGTCTAELELSPAEDLGYLLADMSD